ncbi:hypothetical protein D0T49_12120 [Paludibacter sp. 221]|uniref:hypothetical protein n=1 Tax=Paludibacter sp. 221 TaxID=2302939 RepID=UPI0013D6A578|nr:hypothetical protein [Paludibacter sp. 221]NDV47792.1 hypothetical protein [Paludibacter sp. 221]
MRTNGYIQYRIAGTSGFNDDGEPVVRPETWSETIPCLVKTNTHRNNGAYEDGNFTVASYEVLIEEAQAFSADRVKLARQGMDLGEFQVQNSELLAGVGRVKISV